MFTESELINRLMYFGAQTFRGASARELASMVTPVANSIVRKGAWHSEADLAKGRQALLNLKERQQTRKAAAAVGATNTSEIANAIKTNAQVQAALDVMQNQIDQMLRKSAAPAEEEGGACLGDDDDGAESADAPGARPVAKAAGAPRPAVSRREFIVAGPRANPLAVQVAKRAAAQRMVAPIATGGGFTIGFAGR